MKISRELAGLDIEVSLMEPVVNREGSKYIEEHYSKIVAAAVGMGVPVENAKDMVHDMYINMYIEESQGEGYDVNHCEGRYTSVSDFVYGRLKGYAKNKKYLTPGVQVLGSRKIRKGGEVVKGIAISASFEAGGDESCSNDSIQLKYMESSYDDGSLQEVEEGLSIRDTVGYCFDFSDLHGLEIKRFLQNRNLIADSVAECGGDTKILGKALGRITEAVRDNDEFAEALQSILAYGSVHSQELDKLLEEF